MFKLKYKNEDKFIDISGYTISQNVVGLIYENCEENLSGFSIYTESEKLLCDCFEYRYRYDVLEDGKKAIYYSDRPDIVQTVKFNINNDTFPAVDPLNAEELTECVAELIYETSLLSLGI